MLALVRLVFNPERVFKGATHYFIIIIIIILSSKGEKHPPLGPTCLLFYPGVCVDI